MFSTVEVTRSFIIVENSTVATNAASVDANVRILTATQLMEPVPGQEQVSDDNTSEPGVEFLRSLPRTELTGLRQLPSVHNAVPSIPIARRYQTAIQQWKNAVPRLYKYPASEIEVVVYRKNGQIDRLKRSKKKQGSSNSGGCSTSSDNDTVSLDSITGVSYPCESTADVQSLAEPLQGSSKTEDLTLNSLVPSPSAQNTSPGRFGCTGLPNDNVYEVPGQEQFQTPNTSTQDSGWSEDEIPAVANIHNEDDERIKEKNTLPLTGIDPAEPEADADESYRVQGVETKTFTKEVKVEQVGDVDEVRKPVLVDISTETEGLQPEMTDISTGTQGLLPEMINTSTESHDLQPTMTDVSTEIHDLQPTMTDVSTEIHDLQPKMTDVSTESHDLQPKMTDVSTESRDLQPKMTDVSTESLDLTPKMTDVSTDVSSHDLKPWMADVSTESHDLQPTVVHKFVQEAAIMVPVFTQWIPGEAQLPVCNVECQTAQDFQSLETQTDAVGMSNFGCQIQPTAVEQGSQSDSLKTRSVSCQSFYNSTISKEIQATVEGKNAECQFCASDSTKMLQTELEILCPTSAASCQTVISGEIKIVPEVTDNCTQTTVSTEVDDMTFLNWMPLMDTRMQIEKLLDYVNHLRSTLPKDETNVEAAPASSAAQSNVKCEHVMTDNDDGSKELESAVDTLIERFQNLASRRKQRKESFRRQLRDFIERTPSARINKHGSQSLLTTHVADESSVEDCVQHCSSLH